MTDPREFAVDVARRPAGAPGPLVVRVAGDLDYASHARLESELDAVLRETPAAVVVDLTDVAYCDSCGLRVLLGAAQNQRRLGGDFTLRGAGGQPGRALRLTGLDAVLGGVDGDPSTADGPTVRA